MEGKNFLVYRARKNLTQQDLAELLNVSRELINKIENGKISISKIVEVKMEELEKGE